MTNKELLEIAIMGLEKGFSIYQVMDSDYLYDASEEDKEKVAGYMTQIIEIGIKHLKEKVK